MEVCGRYCNVPPRSLGMTTFFPQLLWELPEDDPQLPSTLHVCLSWRNCLITSACKAWSSCLNPGQLWIAVAGSEAPAGSAELPATAARFLCPVLPPFPSHWQTLRTLPNKPPYPWTWISESAPEKRNLQCQANVDHVIMRCTVLDHCLSEWTKRLKRRKNIQDESRLFCILDGWPLMVCTLWVSKIGNRQGVRAWCWGGYTTCVALAQALLRLSAA